MSLAANLSKGVYKKFRQSITNKYKKIGLSVLHVRRLKNLPENKYHTTKFFDGSITFFHREELIHGIEEIFINEIYKTSFPADSSPVILDCGANIGLSVIYFKIHHPNSTITAFEPDEKNYELLVKNINSMGLSDVEVRKEAVWIKDTTLNFSSEGSTASRIEDDNENKSKKSIRVKATRLNDLLKSKVDMLKMDIEGAEYEVIKDIEDKLHFVQLLFLEYHGTFQQNTRLTEMLDILTRNGFQFYIKEAHNVYQQPFHDHSSSTKYDIQLNIFAFKTR
jgi:FkbM family methyltransferase